MSIKRKFEELLENEKMQPRNISIRIGNVCGLLMTGTAFSLLRESSVYFSHNLTISMLSFSSCAIMNLLLEKLNSCPETQKFKQVSVMRGLITLHLFPILWNTFYLGEHVLSRLQLYSESRFIVQMGEMADSEDVLLFMEDAIDHNSYIDFEKKEIIQKLFPYFRENPYLDYEQVYLNLATLQIYLEEDPEKSGQGTVAEYFPSSNMIRFYDQNDDVRRYLPHEVLHATGKLHTRFMCEGFVSILVSEYLYDGKFVDGYISEIYLTSIMIELAGKDAVLEAFSKGDDQIFMNSLEKKMSHEEVDFLLTTFEEYAQVMKQYRKNQITVQESVDAFLETGKILMYYVEKMELEQEQKAYAYQCFLDAAKGTELPKFCYNCEKDLAYPEEKFSSDEVVDSFQKLLNRSLD